MKETQGELLLRAEELREALWGVCDRKAEEAEAEQAKVCACVSQCCVRRRCLFA